METRLFPYAYVLSEDANCGSHRERVLTLAGYRRKNRRKGQLKAVSALRFGAVKGGIGQLEELVGSMRILRRT
jgi:hypothetical protein